jgi:hypothetical protein
MLSAIFIFFFLSFLEINQVLRRRGDPSTGISSTSIIGGIIIGIIDIGIVIGTCIGTCIGIGIGATLAGALDHTAGTIGRVDDDDIDGAVAEELVVAQVAADVTPRVVE